MRIGEYFTLSELIRTSTGASNEIVEPEHLVNVTRLICLCLDPLRHELGRLDVTSGFRSKEVNEIVGGASTSYHLFGLAADIVSPDKNVDEIADTCMMLGLPFDKIIIERRDDAEWLHIQIARVGEVPRGEVYTARERNGGMIYTRI